MSEVAVKFIRYKKPVMNLRKNIPDMIPLHLNC